MRLGPSIELLATTLSLVVGEAARCPPIEVRPSATIYELELGSSVNITCQHSCTSAINLAHTISIQIPDDYSIAKLHSQPLIDGFLKHKNLTGKINMRPLRDENCINNVSYFHLELSAINTTRLGNSVIHCGAMTDSCHYYADGIAYLKMQQPGLLPSTSIQETTTTPTETPYPSSLITPSPSPTADATSGPVSVSSSESVSLRPSNTPSGVEVSSQQKGGVRDVSLGGVIIGALLVGMLLGVLFGVLITSVLVRRARNSRREEMAELERRRDEMAELERRREEMAELERKEIRRGSVEGDGTGRLRQGEQASSRSTLPAHIAVMITNPSAPDLPLQETPPETPSPCPSQSSSS